MIQAIRFRNFKALRDSVLPLGPLSLLIGPNGSGKSTVLDALQLTRLKVNGCLSAGVAPEPVPEISVEIVWGGDEAGKVSKKRGDDRGTVLELEHTGKDGQQLDNRTARRLAGVLDAIQVFSFQAAALVRPVQLTPKLQLSPSGSGLAGILDQLRDEHPERFEALAGDFCRCLPEFDRILFYTPQAGHKGLKLRARTSQHAIRAADVSQGTLLALAILTLAYLPDPPPIIGLEEPGRGIHPRLLRDVRDAIYRLAYPESAGEQREPTQVIATTHSPYLLDLFKDHPEEIVIANKVEGNVEFTRLSDMPNVDQVLADAALGELWYTGVLGGVPAER